MSNHYALLKVIRLPNFSITIILLKSEVTSVYLNSQWEISKF